MIHNPPFFAIIAAGLVQAWPNETENIMWPPDSRQAEAKFQKKKKKLTKIEKITPVHISLHWLPVYKGKILDTSLLLVRYELRRTLWSLETCSLSVQTTRTKQEETAFSMLHSSITPSWNPENLQQNLLGPLTHH